MYPICDAQHAARAAQQVTYLDHWRNAIAKSLAAYLDSIRQDQAPPVPGLAGLQELQFEAALRRSIADRRPVDVQKEFPL